MEKMPDGEDATQRRRHTEKTPDGEDARRRRRQTEKMPDVVLELKRSMYVDDLSNGAQC